MHPQERANALSLQDPTAFWSRQAEHISWFDKPDAVITHFTKRLASGNSHPSWQWFPGGRLNTCYNCVDRHVDAGNGTAPAIFWHSEVANTREVLTYAQLKEEVEVLAGVLRDLGVTKGDRVVIYMPMIPQTLIAMLAAARLGAIHAVVFGGFGAHALAQRIDSCSPKVILTASCGLEGPSKIIEYQPLVRGALEISKSTPSHVLVWQRPQLPWSGGVDPSRDAGETDWETTIANAKTKRVKAECVPLKAEDGLYIIYTSGTTGAPKGVLRQNGGHAVGLHLLLRAAAFRGPGDVALGVSDIGWVTGHSFVLYGPLLAGGATVLYEGKPVGTPDAGVVWRLVQQYKVNTIFTAPTALRAIRRADPRLALMTKVGETGGLKSLRALWLTGERSQPALVQIFQDMLTQHAACGAIMNDNWGLSEQGQPISSTDLIPSASFDPLDLTYKAGAALKVTPGCAGKPMPGMDVHVVDDNGNEVPNGTIGNMVLGLPLSPSSFCTLWADPERFFSSYLKRFDGRWFDTGDAGMMTSEGIHILSRSDDVINVAAHRLSTGAIEQSIASHPAVAECCVIGIPDELKGHLPFAFVVTFTLQDEAQLFAEIQKLVRTQQGSISALGGMIYARQGENLIPKTRSGKMLRRNLRELVENATSGDIEKEINVPATIEDPMAINAARKAIQAYFEQRDSNPKAKL